MKLNVIKFLIITNITIFIISLGIVYYRITIKLTKETEKLVKEEVSRNELHLEESTLKKQEEPSLNPIQETTLPSPLQEKRVRNIRFVYFSRTAKRVAIIGDFNDWLPQQLTKVTDNQWQIDIKIPEGRYLYNFLVDGKILLDPNNRKPPEVSPEGFKSSVLDLRE